MKESDGWYISGMVFMLIVMGFLLLIFKEITFMGWLICLGGIISYGLISHLMDSKKV